MFLLIIKTICFEARASYQASFILLVLIASFVHCFSFFSFIVIPFFLDTLNVQQIIYMAPKNTGEIKYYFKNLWIGTYIGIFYIANNCVYYALM